MTYEELQHYNKLSYSEREQYDDIKKAKPNWSHGQILAKVKMQQQMDLAIEKGGENLNPSDPMLWLRILEKVKRFFKEVGIDDVIKLIDNALDTLGDIIYRGISHVGNALQKIWDWIG